MGAAPHTATFAPGTNDNFAGGAVVGHDCESVRTGGGGGDA